MFPVRIGRHVLRWATSPQDMARVLQLRALVFRQDAGPQGDRDRFDDLCRHLLIESTQDGTLEGCLRLQVLSPADAEHTAYCAQFYDLAPLCDMTGRMLEVGRLCTHPERADPEVLRLAFAALSAVVLDEEIRFLFGATSFAGTDPAPYLASFDQLRGRIAPDRWRPRRRAPCVYPFARAASAATARRGAGMHRMPPLLRGYLGLGCRVSDHAVIDPDLGTLHVFTGLEPGSVPPGRARLLRAAAQGLLQ